MKKAIILPIILSTIVLAGCSLNKSSSDAMMKKDDAMMKKDDVMMKKDDAMMKKDDVMMKKDSAIMQTGSTTGSDIQQSIKMQKNQALYLPYSQPAVDMALQDGNTVALSFHASRCPGCKSLDADITSKLATLPINTVIFKVDYDTSTDLKKKYGVTSQMTIVRLNKDMTAKAKITTSKLTDVISLLQ